MSSVFQTSGATKKKKAEICTACGDSRWRYANSYRVCLNCDNQVADELENALTYDSNRSRVGKYHNKSRERVKSGHRPNINVHNTEAFNRGDNHIVTLTNCFELDDSTKVGIKRKAQQYLEIVIREKFARGRDITHIAAVCVYQACLDYKKPYLLLDFAQFEKCNVFALGNLYIKLARMFTECPILLDPSLYVLRFTRQMFEDIETVVKVGITALRIISEMKRNWIEVGRRPTGLCGAALFLASRIHGFNFSHDDIAKMVRVCNGTLNKRIMETANTPAAKYSYAELVEQTAEIGGIEIFHDSDRMLSIGFDKDTETTHAPQSFLKHIQGMSNLKSFQDVLAQTQEAIQLDEELTAEHANDPYSRPIEAYQNEHLQELDGEIDHYFCNDSERFLRYILFNNYFSNHIKQKIKKKILRLVRPKVKRVRKKKQTGRETRIGQTSRINMKKVSQAPSTNINELASITDERPELIEQEIEFEGGNDRMLEENY
ncbi:hypothetical protein PCE1_003710 [Barthelona sp. PCE]